MVDEVRVLRLLRAITDDVGVLESEAAADEVRRDDGLWLRGVKYTFITAIEACVDVAQHLCSSEGWGPPADNGDAIRLLGVHRVLRAELTYPRAAAALVHRSACAASAPVHDVGGNAAP